MSDYPKDESDVDETCAGLNVKFSEDEEDTGKKTPNVKLVLSWGEIILSNSSRALTYAVI